VCGRVYPSLVPRPPRPVFVHWLGRSFKRSIIWVIQINTEMWVGTIAGLNYWTTELDYWTHPNCHKCLVQCRTETKCTYPLASFPGLHAQLLSLAVRKTGEGLDGLITWCVPRLMSRTVASHDRSSSNRTRRTNWTERTNWIQGKKSEGERTNPDVSKLNMTSAMACITW